MITTGQRARNYRYVQMPNGGVYVVASYNPDFAMMRWCGYGWDVVAPLPTGEVQYGHFHSRQEALTRLYSLCT